MSLLTREDLVGSLFFPEPSQTKPPAGARDVFVEVDGATLHVRVHGDAAKPLVLFFHGNGETVADWDELAPGFTSHVQFAVSDYRGYGQSTGVPTMQRLFDDAVAVFDVLASQVPLMPMVMGRSLGSAAAWHLAQVRPCRAVIVDSGFSDVDAFARRRGVSPSSLSDAERSALDPLEKARAFDGPMLLLHGAQDTLIPFGDATRLANANPRVTLHLIPRRGHNDVLLDDVWWEQLHAFFDQHAPHPLLAVTLKQAPLKSFRVVVDVEGKTTFHDAPSLEAARSYAADVRLEGDAPGATLAIVFDARGRRIDS